MTLTEGLLALAGLVLAILLGQGAWASWRARPRVADVLPPERAEPDLAPAGDERSEPSWGEDDAAQPPRPASLRVKAAVQLDPLVDLVVELALDAPVSGETALSALPGSRRAGSKPLLFEGLDTEQGAWESVQPGARYSALQVGVQLANRAGSLNEIEFSEFVQRVSHCVEALGAHGELPDMVEAVARARELDEFAHAHDAQLAIHIHARSTAWTVGYLTQVARRHGLVQASVAGRWVLPGESPEAPPLVGLSFDQRAALADDADNATLRQFTLSLDVPQSAAELDPFSQWLRLADAMVADMDGVLVDDSGRPVSTPQVAGIRSELEALYAALAARGLAAGSLAARRLFS